jgi:hypothetical protein
LLQTRLFIDVSDTVQDRLNPYLKDLHAIDTHNLPLCMDFKYPVGKPAAFKPSAKPDLTAQRLPLFWEVSRSCVCVLGLGG